VLDRKQANPGSVVEITPSENQAIVDWRSMSAALAAYNEGLVPINEELVRRKELAGSVDLAPLTQSLASLQASRRRHQQDVIDAYASFDAAVQAQATAQEAKQSANDALRAQSNQLMAEYGARINELLDLFSVEFRIVGGANNDNYVTFGGGRPSGQLALEILGTRISSSPADAANPARPSLANTLSGGDRSALALAFFLAKVEQEPELANSVIVFDDPFHSQDRSRQSRTIERIHGIARDAKQCFVLSHDLEFARAVATAHGVASRTFYLDPLVDQTTLQAKELPMLPSRAYEQKYTLLDRFISEPAEFTSQLNNVAGTLRTILEEYLQFKFPRHWTEGQDWLGTMIGKISGATGDDPFVNCQDIVDDLTQVNEYSQRFHHRTTGATADVPDARELVTYARQTLSIIHK
jgi:wobble nucleotide-excising tRNase